MKEVEISGRFINDLRQPAYGLIRFAPSVLWVEEGGEFYAPLATETQLIDGKFKVKISRTDTSEIPWHYTVFSPVGRWSIFVTDDGPLLLRDLLPKRFA